MTEQETGFHTLGLSADILSAIEIKGFTTPSPIQAATIPLLLKNDKDIVGQAQTGTGKTAAFGLPLIDLLKENQKNVQAIILVPTRELAIQVTEELSSFKGNKKLFITTLYGGQSIVQQMRDLKRGVDIVVGTPGRVMDHLERGTLRIDQISHVILDEADEMLNMGFVEDIESILSTTPDEKRVILFSATMPSRILDIAKNYMGPYELVAVKKQHLTTDLVEQIYYEISSRDKREALARIIDSEPNFYGLIFCQTKLDTDDVAHWLVERGYAAEALHGDVSQNQREKILALFKKKRINMVVATDVAARGIDINNLSHVINYSLPQEAEVYVHRIGRTGRAGKKGVAIALVTPGDSRKFATIKRLSKAPIEKKRLPDAKDIVSNKIIRLKDSLGQLIEENGIEKYEEIAATLLEGNDALKLVAAMLKTNYADAFDITAYQRVREVKSDERAPREDRFGRFDRGREDRFGKGPREERGTARRSSSAVRLFLAKGKLDDMTPRKLVDYIEDETRVSQRIIDDVKVMEKFSFFSVPFEEAEQIVRHFKQSGRGGRSLVERAKD